MSLDITDIAGWPQLVLKRKLAGRRKVSRKKRRALAALNKRFDRNRKFRQIVTSHRENEGSTQNWSPSLVLDDRCRIDRPKEHDFLIETYTPPPRVNFKKSIYHLFVNHL